MPRLYTAASLVLSAATLAGCSGEGGGTPPEATGPSRAYGIWQPAAGECSAEIHNGYSAVGPDGKLYPTWHPPTDPATNCSFGHEHGRDPRGSRLYRDMGPVLFGFANEQLDIWDPSGQRHEDHVGHKVDWENDLRFRVDGLAGALLEVRCDVLTKLHQGTHSRDAYTNNLHELVYRLSCNDGARLNLTVMAAIGRPGEFVRGCDHETVVAVGAPTPANSPSGGGRRLLPDRTCVEQLVLVAPGSPSNFSAGLRESWETSVTLRRENGQGLVHIDPYFQVRFPSRYHDPNAPQAVGRTVAICSEVEPNGDRASGELCDRSTANGTDPSVAFDDPRSAFNGVLRFVDINRNRVTNLTGPTAWYTDPFGRHGRPDPFPGSIRQFIAAVDTDYQFDVSGPAIGRNRDYGGPGVHAPN